MTENVPMTINYSDPKIVSTLKQTVAQGATEQEFAMFAQFCQSTRLNPFKKEIWFIKAGGRVQLMTGINGYWSIANSHPQFDGAETGMISKDGEWVKSVPGNDFIGAWCRVYRKDRKIPMEGEALLSDYRKGSPLWQNSPRIMIKKVAQSIALRQAFPQELNGLYTEEEMPREYAAPDKSEEQVVQIAGPIFYDFGDTSKLSDKQKAFIGANTSWDDSKGCWVAQKDLGPKLELFRVRLAKVETDEQRPETEQEDDVPTEWTENADKLADEQAEEMAKARLASMKQNVKAKRAA